MHTEKFANGPAPAETWTGAVEKALDRHRGEPGPLLAVLHDIQDAIGWIPPESHGRLAEALSLSKADVYGVVTFYHDFRSSPPGRHVLKLCRAEACQAMGAEALATRVKAKLGIEFGLTSPDGAVTLQPVYCLGNCACSPALMIDGNLVGRVTTERLDQIVADARATR
jgi:formate dehydrogenase subunit gamma